MEALRIAAVLVLVPALGLPACRARKSNERPAPPQGHESERAPLAAEAESPVRLVYPAGRGSFVELTKKLAPSVLHLRSTSKVKGGPGILIPGTADSDALGTAFVLDREGHLVTNEHVISTAPEIRAVLASGLDVPVQVVGRDSTFDLALLKIDVPASQLTPLRLGDSDALQVGEAVLALGNPQGSEVTASAGIVSALGTSNHDAIVGVKTNYHSFIRTDAKIDVGNSGGPLVDSSGAVIGINTALADQSSDIRLALPSNRLAQIFPMLKRDGLVTRTWLGVMVHPVTMEVAKERKLEQPAGALVSSIVPSSPAARAGLLAGDIILEFDGKKVNDRSLPWLASTTGVGQHITLVIWRNGQERPLSFLSEKMPD